MTAILWAIGFVLCLVGYEVFSHWRNRKQAEYTTAMSKVWAKRMEDRK